MTRYRVTVDTGGTFSDFVYLNEDTGAVTIAKVASTPDDPSRAILAGIDVLLADGVKASDIGYLCHGTTVGTNALLEQKGVKTGLLVTEGFRGIYPVGEQARPYGPAIFDVMFDKPAMLVPQSLTGEVSERIDFQGQVLKRLDEAALRQTAQNLAAQGVESMAICLLFSFLNPAHERRVCDILREEVPGCSISLSSAVLPQIREYYRLSTTVINAYLQPILARYIAELDRRLAGAGVTTRQTYIMQSNGGMATFAGAAERPVTTLLSGPAGGVTAGVHACRMTGQKNIITFDMGGTSCDVALIRDGEAAVASRSKIDGRDIAAPSLDINTVSAGGGTVAAVDRFGRLAVGPTSAGAMPGPACYGRGGTQPTITDCNLVLGRLSFDNFLGGRMQLDRGRASGAIAEHVAEPLGLDVMAAAEGVIRIINVKMEEAIKAISTMRGYDLRDFWLLAFGGAGPVHAGRIARDLGMAGTIVPLYPGVYSALGLMLSDVKHDYVQSKMAALARVAPEEIAAMFDRLAVRACADLQHDGFAPGQIHIQRALDLRYAGQGYEVTLACDDPIEAAALRARFDQEHKALFGHMAPEEPVEIVSYRVRGVGVVPPVELPTFTPAGTTLQDALRETRTVRFDGVVMDCPVYRRELIDVGLTVGGPAILDQLDCTTVIYPGQAARVDRWKNLIVEEA